MTEHTSKTFHFNYTKPKNLDKKTYKITLIVKLRQFLEKIDAISEKCKKFYATLCVSIFLTYICRDKQFFAFIKCLRVMCSGS